MYRYRAVYLIWEIHRKMARGSALRQTQDSRIERKGIDQSSKFEAHPINGIAQRDRQLKLKRKGFKDRRIVDFVLLTAGIRSQRSGVRD